MSIGRVHSVHAVIYMLYRKHAIQLPNVFEVNLVYCMILKIAKNIFTYNKDKEEGIYIIFKNIKIIIVNAQSFKSKKKRLNSIHRLTVGEKL